MLLIYVNGTSLADTKYIQDILTPQHHIMMLPPSYLLIPMLTVPFGVCVTAGAGVSQWLPVEPLVKTIG